MKATISRKYQRNSWWNSGLRELDLYIEYDGESIYLKGGHSETIYFEPKVKHIRIVAPNAKKSFISGEMVDLVKTLIIKDINEEATIDIKFKGIQKAKLAIKYSSNIKSKLI